jgi:C_GCAxxG_C_C family probable redox protein
MEEKETIFMACSHTLKIKSLGNHCSQACLCGLAPYLGLDEAYAMKLMAALGGGMRHQQLCGAVMAAGVALGLAFGVSKVKKNEDEKKADNRLGELTIEFIDKFTKELGTTVCGQLLTDKLESFHWDMPTDIGYINTVNNENGNEFNLKAPICGVAMISAVKYALEIIQREKNGI